MIELTVPLRTPSGNNLSGYHWSKRVRLRQDWQLMLRVALNAQRHFGELRLARVKLEVVRHAAVLIRDHDNLVAGLKPVLDAMVQVGLLVDDGREVIAQLEVRQAKCARKLEHTTLRIEPLAPAPAIAGSSCRS